MLTADRLREVLSYDKATGVFRWLMQLSSRGAIGDRAGCIRDDGYRIIGIDGESHLAHRLAWLYVTGEWPAHEVDHKNVTPGDDWWENLRPATGHQNRANRRAQRNNKSGYKGVSWYAAGQQWQATIRANGRTTSLGRFDDPQDAHAAYASAAAQRFGEFARAI